MKKICIPAFLCLLLVSCTLTKRHYRSGFHLHWHHGVHTAEQADEKPEQRPVDISPAESTNLQKAADSLEPVLPTPEIVLEKQKTVKKEENRSAVGRQKIPAPLKLKKTFSFFDGETERQERSHANSALVLGLAGILFLPFAFIPILLGLAAIRQGRLALHYKTGKNPGAVKNAKAGIVLGCIVLYYYWIMLIVLAVALFVALLGLTGDITGVFGAVVIAGIWFMLFIVLILLFFMTRLMIRQVF